MGEIFDDYCWTKQKRVMTHNDHMVPGLGNFAFWSYTSATMPSPLHYHTNIFEIHCMVKGVRNTQIEKDGHISTYTYTGNQAMVVFPNEIHGNGFAPQQPCEFYAFQIDVSDPRCLLGLNKEYSLELYQILKNIKKEKRRLLSLSQTHINYLRSAFNFFSEKEDFDIHVGVQFLTAFLFTLPFLQSSNNNQESNVDPRLIDAMTYVRTHMDRSINLSMLANVSGYSLSRFKYKFKNEIGITPSEYITLQKMNEAKRLLHKTDISITDIAYSLGFTTSNYFTTVFKKINSISPKDYRKMMKSRDE